MTAVFLCSFSSLDDLFPIGRSGNGRKRRGVTDADVLRLLDQAKRFSSFESERALGYITHLERRRLITTDPEAMGFPWVRVTLTDAGRALLEAQQ